MGRFGVQIIPGGIPDKMDKLCELREEKSGRKVFRASKKVFAYSPSVSQNLIKSHFLTLIRVKSGVGGSFPSSYEMENTVPRDTFKQLQ